MTRSVNFLSSASPPHSSSHLSSSPSQANSPTTSSQTARRFTAEGRYTTSATVTRRRCRRGSLRRDSRTT
ncbi:hypothetical protein Bca52824_093115 [Brassica carinata]|uniref:Uncharacterized protein n=1 Tax=Brassica carinata TaxID=52824 RepID=A0A8X7P6M1_BRACI|nr:hypothetical protein Bca52824_093115 [Brassica carinata]